MLYTARTIWTNEGSKRVVPRKHSPFGGLNDGRLIFFLGGGQTLQKMKFWGMNTEQETRACLNDKIHILVNWKLLSRIMTNYENPRWRRPPYWILENVNISRLDEGIYTKFGGKVQHAIRMWPLNQKTEPEVNLRHVIKQAQKSFDLMDYYHHHYHQFIKNTCQTHVLT